MNLHVEFFRLRTTMHLNENFLSRPVPSSDGAVGGARGCRDELRRWVRSRGKFYKRATSGKSCRRCKCHGNLKHSTTLSHRPSTTRIIPCATWVVCRQNPDGFRSRLESDSDNEAFYFWPLRERAEHGAGEFSGVRRMRVVISGKTFEGRQIFFSSPSIRVRPSITSFRPRWM